jgi:hypothetical protein
VTYEELLASLDKYPKEKMVIIQRPLSHSARMLMHIRSQLD